MINIHMDLLPSELEAVGKALKPFEADIIARRDAYNNMISPPLPPEAERTPPPETTQKVEGFADDVEPAAEQVFGKQTTAPTETTPPPQTETPPPPANTAEVDSEGMPWDERIHSKNKSTIGNGTWKLKRGVDKNLVAQVKAEYGLGNPQPTPTTTPSAPTSPLAGTPTPPVQQPPVQQAPPPEPQQPDATGVAYPQIVAQITSGIGGQKFTPMDVAQMLQNQFGIASTAEIQNHPQLFGQIQVAISNLAAGVPNAQA